MHQTIRLTGYIGLRSFSVS